jgi:toxin ParE1/3/4
MAYEVRLTHAAERDLDDIYGYLAEFQSLDRADRVLTQILEVTDRLASMPDKAPFPPELADVGIRAFRQVVSWPYRVIYRVQGQLVTVLLVADGRRNMQSLLAQRLLAG